MKRVTLELSAETLCLLEVLDERGNAETVLHELVARVIDGVRRPGSWERQWLHQAFGDEWTQRMEPDPEVQWWHRPRRR